MKRLIAGIALLGFVVAAPASEVQLDKVELPEGFRIEVFADAVPNARQMALGEKGTLFVGSRRAGNVYAVVDADGDHRADTVHTIAEGLNLPSGIAFRDGCKNQHESCAFWAVLGECENK